MNINNLLIIIPTYNEIENLNLLINKLRTVEKNLNLLFIDDSSPDGTGIELARLSLDDPFIKVIHRDSKLGIGSAHKIGINWAYENDYFEVITMDSDLSHNPSYISNILLIENKSEVIIGSRFIENNSLVNWNIYRKIMTNIGHFLTKLLLTSNFDATNAFRYYNLKKIPSELFNSVESNGYSFFYESLFRLIVNKINVTEIPISIPSRTYGNSKMGYRDVLYSLKFIFELYFRYTLNKSSFIIK